MQWLQIQTSNAPAPLVILHLGAGYCQELEAWRSMGASRIILVEPNPEVLPELRRTVATDPNVEVLPIAVAAESGQRALRLFNEPGLASLRSPIGLVELLPGLRQTGKAMVDVVAAQAFLQDLNLEDGGCNWLVIDTPGEEAAIIDELEKNKQLTHFEHIVIRAGATSLYKDARPAEQLIGKLNEIGYVIEGVQDRSDPDWPRYHLKLCKKTIECRRLGLENKALAEEKEKLEKRNQQLTETLRQQDEIEARNGELKLRLEELAEKKEMLEQHNKQLAEQVAHYKSTKELIGGLEKSLSKNIHQSRVQIESYIALKNYLDCGELMPSLHGWTISPDLAIELVRLIESEDYEMVVEFGSGSSTVLMARCLVEQRHEWRGAHRQLTPSEDAADHNLQASDAPRSLSHERALPDRIVAFEHHRSYFEKTTKMLKQSGLLGVVNLVYAPLKEWVRNEKSYLFYDCDQHIEHLANTLQRERSKILVLVDGPPGATNPHSRYPALPKILNSLSAHELHVLLDDTNRTEEKEIISAWEELLQARSLLYEKVDYPFEKGACLIKCL